MKQKKVQSPQSDYKWEAERLRDRQMVRGIFRFHEVRGGLLAFSYRKWKGDPIESFSLRDGSAYLLPLGVATHLKESGWYPKHQHAVEEKTGRAIQIIGQKIKRYTFEPIDFIADERWQSNNADKAIVAVSYV